LAIGIERRAKTLAALLLALSFCLASGAASAFDFYVPVTTEGGHWGTASTGWLTESTGTPTDPYIIATADDLAGLAKLCDEGNGFIYKNFALASDIDLGEREWEPIGWFWEYMNNHYAPFNGVFDGRGHTVSGLKITTMRAHDAGLFAYIGPYGAVRNLRVEGAHVDVTEGAGSRGASGIVAFHDGLVENCFADGYFNSEGDRTYVAPVTSIMSNGTVRNAVTGGTAISIANTSYAGGVVGYIMGTGTVENCAVEAESLYGFMDAGGIVGGNLGNGPIYNSSSAAGSVTSPLYAAGVTAIGGLGRNNHWLKANENQPLYAGSYGGDTATAGRVEDLALLPVSSAMPLLEAAVLVGESVTVSTTLHPSGGSEEGLVFNWTAAPASRVSVSGAGTSAAVSGIAAGEALVTLTITNPAWTGNGTGRITLTGRVRVIQPAPPSGPLNLRVSPGDGTLTLRWDAPADNGGREITGYEVSVGGSAWTPADGAESHAFTGLTNGAEYSLSVRAVNAEGAGAPASVTGRPSGTATAPEKPRGLAASAASGSVALTWAAPSSDGGSAITGYEVSSNAGAGSAVWSAADGETSHTFTGLANGTAYSFGVRAVNAAGAGEAETVTAAPLGAASEPREFAAVSGDRFAALSWTSPEDDGGSPVTGYKVWSLATGWTDAQSETSHTFTGLTNGRHYTFRVRAVTGAGEGAIASAELDLDESGPGGSGGYPDGVLSVETVTAAEAPEIAGATGIPEGSFSADALGSLVFNGTDAAILAQEAWPDDGITGVLPLPVKKAAVKSEGGVAPLTFTLKGSDLYAKRAMDVRVMKILGGGKTGEFRHSATGDDMTFSLRLGDRPHIGAISSDLTYTLVLFVKDGGPFDLDPEKGRIIDPAAVINAAGSTGSGPSTDSPGSSGGCGAVSLPAFALAIFAVSAAVRRRSKR
jgi:hypothetical protein